MTLVPTDKMFGQGQTESFLLADPAPVIKEAKQMQRTGTRTSLLDYRPHITTANEARHKRLHNIGLDSLARAEEQEIPVAFTRALYPEMTGETLATWRKFLPTRYVMRDFAYDSIPDEALGHIESAQSLKCFDSIRIWSPEGNDIKGREARRREKRRRQREERRALLMRSVDPMAVGIISDSGGTKHYFPIVRWGESLAPFEEIRKFVRAVDRQEHHTAILRRIGWGALWTGIAAAVVGLVTAYINWVIATNGAALWAIPFGFVGLLFIGMMAAEG